MLRGYILRCATALLLMVAILSCKRQVLESPEYLLASIPIAVDWSKSEVPTESIANVSAYFYPVDGGEPSVFISSDINFVVAEVPMGEYYVLIFNEIAGNTSGMVFKSVNERLDFKIEAVEQPAIMLSSMIYYEQGSEYVIDTPDPMGSWGAEETITVTADMIDYTHTSSYASYITLMKSLAGDPDELMQMVTRGDDAQLDGVSEQMKAISAIESLSLLYPEPVTASCSINLRVENLSNAQWIECVVRGLSKSTTLYDRESAVLESGDEPIMFFTFSSREFDPGSTVDGVVSHTLLTFGKQPTDDAVYELVFTAVLASGESVTVTRDVSDQINNSDGIDITIELTSDSEQMELPEGRADGFGVTDWGEAEDVELM